MPEAGGGGTTPGRADYPQKFMVFKQILLRAAGGRNYFSGRLERG